MSAVVNLNRVRKAKAREEAIKSATVNRIAFGRTKAEKTRSVDLDHLAKRRLDQAKRDET